MQDEHAQSNYRSRYLTSDLERLRFAILLLIIPSALYTGYDLAVHTTDPTPGLTYGLRGLFFAVSALVWWWSGKLRTPAALDGLIFLWAGIAIALVLGNAWTRPAHFFGHYLFEILALMMFYTAVPLSPRYKLALGLLYLLFALLILFGVKETTHSRLLHTTAIILPLTVISGYFVATHIEGYRRTAYQATLELEAIARSDPLTGISNRRAFMQWADREVSRSTRVENQELSVLILDLDHFKQVNDRYGHAVGDKVLIEFCRRIEETLRRYDLLARMGGEEFVVGLPRCNLDDAVQTAERIRLAISGAPFCADTNPIALTVSIGAACLHAGESEIDGALGRADRALYEAKRLGRDKVCREEPPSFWAKDTGDSGSQS